MGYSYYKQIAKDSLSGKWNTVIVGSLLYVAVISICQIPSLVSSIYDMIVMLEIEVPEFLGSIYAFFAYSPFNIISGLFNTFALPVFAFGFFSIGYKAVNRQKIDNTTMFDGFRNFGNVFILNLLIGIYTFLWMLLFIIPGIVKGLSYSMANFIMAENPEISPSDAIKESKKLMDGNKLDYFMLGLSFIGWHILDFFTLGILSIWLIPYIYTTEATFYEAIKNEKYGDYAPYVYKNMLYIQLENGFFDPQQYGAPYGQNPNGYVPNQQGVAPYGQNPNGYAPYQQGVAPYGQNPHGYVPYQQNGAPYTNSPQGFISDEYGNPIPAPRQNPTPESQIGVNPSVSEQTGNINFNN